MSSYPRFSSLAGETYGSYCDRMEQKIRDILKRKKDVSKDDVALLGYIAMEVPADFESTCGEPLMEKLKTFLAKQNQKMKEHFRKACNAHPTRARLDRIDALCKV